MNNLKIINEQTEKCEELVAEALKMNNILPILHLTMETNDDIYNDEKNAAAKVIYDKLEEFFEDYACTAVLAKQPDIDETKMWVFECDEMYYVYERVHVTGRSNAGQFLSIFKKEDYSEKIPLNIYEHFVRCVELLKITPCEGM